MAGKTSIKSLTGLFTKKSKDEQN